MLAPGAPAGAEAAAGAVAWQEHVDPSGVGKTVAVEGEHGKAGEDGEEQE